MEKLSLSVAWSITHTDTKPPPRHHAAVKLMVTVPPQKMMNMPTPGLLYAVPANQKTEEENVSNGIGLGPINIVSPRGFTSRTMKE